MGLRYQVDLKLHCPEPLQSEVAINIGQTRWPGAAPRKVDICQMAAGVSIDTRRVSDALEGLRMRRYLLLVLASLLLVTASGCTRWPAQQYDARLESAEANAATARLRADQVCYRIDLVEQTANEALRRATQAQDQIQQLQRQGRRK